MLGNEFLFYEASKKHLAFEENSKAESMSKMPKCSKKEKRIAKFAIAFAAIVCVSLVAFTTPQPNVNNAQTPISHNAAPHYMYY